MSNKLPTTPGSSAPATTKPTPTSTRPKPGAALTALAAQVAARRAEEKANAAYLPRLIFGLDATGSRQPAWDMAVKLQSDMFREVAAIGGLAIQFVYFRGDGECKASQWKTSAGELAASMSKITCRSGVTQIAKVLTHAVKAAAEGQVRALVMVGDSVDGDELDHLVGLAHKLGRLGVPAFMFQENVDPATHQAFRAIADATKGAYCRFDASSADELRDLLKAVATFAVKGTEGLMAMVAADKPAALPAAALLLGQLSGGGDPPTPQPNAKPPTPTKGLADTIEDIIKDDEVDYSIPVAGPKPKSPGMLALEAEMNLITGIERVKQGDVTANTVKAMDAALKLYASLPGGCCAEGAEGDDLGAEAAKLATDAQALANRSHGQLAENAQAVVHRAHALATMLRAKTAE